MSRWPWRLAALKVRLSTSTAFFLQKISTPASRMSAEGQVTNRVLMIRPGLFSYNALTAVDNQFQQPGEGLSKTRIHEKALGEFDGLVQSLKAHNVDVNVVEDTRKVSGDAIFPNNWISFHREGKIVLYPMMAENRRLERTPDIVDLWKKKLGAEVVDYSAYEREGKFLEGTGSMVLDRVNRIVYACISQRTNGDILQKFCHDFNYTRVVFQAAMLSGDRYCPIYHTNVMMSVAETFAIVCLDCVQDKDERAVLSDSLKKSGKEIIPITEDQVWDFAGNGLQLSSCDGKKLFVMSTRSFNSFSAEQLEVIRRHCDEIVHSPLEIIEKLGGGGARCMLAEVFPPK